MKIRVPRYRWITTALLLFAPSLCGCASDELVARIQFLTRVVQTVQAEQQEQNKKLVGLDSELRLAWSNLFCGEKVSQLFEDVDKECSVPKETAAAPPAPNPAGSSCTTKSINPAVVDADDTHKGMFLSVMKNAPSEVLPIGPGSVRDVTPSRAKKLEHLAQSRLRTTRFLVVARTSPKDAQPEVAAAQRARLVIDKLKAMKVPEELIRRWVYRFEMSKKELADYQRDVHVGESKEVDYGVWVFRVNC